MTNVENKTGTTEKSLWEVWVKRIQDILLIGSALTYILGYIVWSFYAAQNKLGPLAVLDAQYFITGTIPAIIILASFLLYILFIKLVVWGKAKLYEKYDDTALSKMRRAMLSYSFVSLVVILGGIYSWVLENDKLSWTGSIFVFAITFASLMVDIKESKFYKFIRGYQTIILIFPITYVAINFYFYNIYQSLPQEFGGVKPRCSYLDVHQSKISLETLQVITPKNISPIDRDVVQTKELDILFSGREDIIIRVDRNVLSISRDVIQVIRKCP